MAVGAAKDVSKSKYGHLAACMLYMTAIKSPATSQAAATACALAVTEEVAVEPAAALELLSLLANGCSRVVSLLPAGTCMWVGGRRRRKRQRWWRERRQRWRQLTMSAFPGLRC